MLAFVIDGFLGILVWSILLGSFGEQFEVPGAGSGFEIETLGNATFIRLGENAWALEGGEFGLVSLVALGWWLFNLVLLTGTTGASIGKLASGIRVVREDGQVCGVGKAFVRWILLIVDAFPYFVPLVGFVMTLTTEGNRRLGDMAASTYVVRRDAVGSPVAVGSALGYPGAYPPAPGGFAGPPAPDARWDPGRGIWIRWDGEAWVGHDAATGSWRRL